MASDLYCSSVHIVGLERTSRVALTNFRVKTEGVQGDQVHSITVWGLGTWTLSVFTQIFVKATRDRNVRPTFDSR